MTGRAYLDWNASAPLRPEARAAMLSAFDRAGNPSSVHAEGRAARAIIETARAQVADLVGCDPDQVVFTSGATEANNAAVRGTSLLYAPTEHASIMGAAVLAAHAAALPTAPDGRITTMSAEVTALLAEAGARPERRVIAVAAANGETGIIEDTAAIFAAGAAHGIAGHCDATQAVGRVPFCARSSGAATIALSAHKLGGPKGVGALIVSAACDLTGRDPLTILVGGAQERHRRAGTENVAGIAGFGAAAAAAAAELRAGVWQAVAMRRDRLETSLASAVPGLVFFGREAGRLPNTTCFAAPGWTAETQVMVLDLAGFAVSAGSACSSGKLKPSHVLLAMGVAEATARCAIRVSLGPTTTDEEIDRFCATWIGLHANRRRLAA